MNRKKRIVDLELQLQSKSNLIAALQNELSEANAELAELRRQNYALEIDNDIYTSALHSMATRRAAEVINGIMAYETQSEAYNIGRINSTYHNDAEMFADVYARAYEQSRKDEE